VDSAKDPYVTLGDVKIDRHDFDAFRDRQLRLSRLFVIALFAVAVACGVAIAVASSVGLGFVVAGVIGVAGSTALKRWNRARWLARFPELQRGGSDWKPGSTGSPI
jgi:hypothetical protein